jgi:hypothetical protein
MFWTQENGCLQHRRSRCTVSHVFPCNLKPWEHSNSDKTNSDALVGEAWPRTWAATPASSRTKAENGSTYPQSLTRRGLVAQILKRPSVREQHPSGLHGFLLQPASTHLLGASRIDISTQVHVGARNAGLSVQIFALQVRSSPLQLPCITINKDVSNRQLTHIQVALHVVHVEDRGCGYQCAAVVVSVGRICRGRSVLLCESVRRRV